MSRKSLTPIVLPGNPTQPLEATPKQYVDALAGGIPHVVSPTEPVSPVDGTLWTNPDENPTAYEWYGLSIYTDPETDLVDGVWTKVDLRGGNWTEWDQGAFLVDGVGGTSTPPTPTKIKIPVGLGGVYACTLDIAIWPVFPSTNGHGGSRSVAVRQYRPDTGYNGLRGLGYAYIPSSGLVAGASWAWAHAWEDMYWENDEISIEAQSLGAAGPQEIGEMALTMRRVGPQPSMYPY